MILIFESKKGKPYLKLTDDIEENKIEFEHLVNSNKYRISINGNILGYMNTPMAIRLQHSISLIARNMK